MERTTIAKNLYALIEQRDITQDAIAAVSGASKGAVSQWLNHGRQPRPKYLQKIADYYGISMDDLTSEQNGLYAQAYGLQDAPPGAWAAAEPRPAYAPLYGRVHAGDADEPALLDDKIPIPYEVWTGHKDGYFLEVEGTCMNRVYPEGCFVFIDPALPPRNGSIAVVSIDTEDYILRRMYRGANRLMLSPESFDPQWEDIIIEEDTEVKMVGTVVWWQSKEEMD